MTGWVVERMPLATLASSVAPTGLATPMPPHSQGAERRMRRWGLRALVIGGLAAAHAAEADPAPEMGSSSLLGAIVDTVAKPVDHVLKAAAQPLDKALPAPKKHVGKDHRAVTTVLDIPARVLARPTGQVTGAHGESDAEPALGAVSHIVQGLTGPLRLTGGPVDSDQLAQVAAPLTKNPRTVTGSKPAHQHETRVTPPAWLPVTGAAAASRNTDHAAVTPVVTTGLPMSSGQPVPPGHQAGHDSVTRATFEGKRHSMVTERSADTATAAPGSTPGGDQNTPQPVQLGALSGISTSASGAPTEGGSTAVLPAAIASGSVATHGLRQTADVEARRHDAEAPTVSPD